MNISSHEFIQNMIEKLSFANEKELSKYNYLEDICRFFDISHAFIYEANHLGELCKKECYEMVRYDALKDKLDMKNLLGAQLLSELCSEKVIIYTENEKSTSLKQKLIEIFNVNTIIFIPILNQHYALAGFIGLADRRKALRHAQADINKACALLTLLANNIKLEMFQKGIENAQATLSNVLDHIGIDIYVNDYYTHDILYANKSMAEPYGGVENMMGKKCWQAIFKDKMAPCDFCPQPKLLDENGNLNKTYQWDYERPFDKSWFRVLSSSFPWTDGRIAHLVASVDITESKRNQILIEQLAQFDYLTGLANRRSLHDDIQLFIADQSIFSDKWYVLFCDLDGFKKVNDTLGHEAGDVLLKGIAQDLKEMCTDEIKAYRQGGDEFVVVIKDKDDNNFLKQIIEDLFIIFRKQYDYNGHQMGCGCSIGVAHYPKDAQTSKEIFHLADTAMYSVKKEGRGTVRFYKNGKYLTSEEYFKED